MRGSTPPPTPLFSLSYVTVNEVASLVAKLGRGAILAKIDVKSAYWNVLVHPLDRPLLGIHWKGSVYWKGRVYCNGMLPFGLHSAPKLFTAVADALEWVVRNSGVSHVAHYLDDFVVLGCPDSEECALNLQTVMQTCDILGVPLARGKTEGPSTALMFLGISIDTIAGSLSLPPHKLQRVRELLSEWDDHKVCTQRELELAYYHNEAQSGKDVCDTHFSHQQTQVDAYLVQGDGGRKVSTAKQLAIALTNMSVSNTTVLLVKPNFQAPCRAAQIPPVPGITEFYAAQYATSAEGKQHIQFYHSLGQNVPSVCVSIPSCSLITPMGVEGVNFTGVSVTLNSDSEGGSVQAMKDKNRYRKRSKEMSKREVQRLKKQEDQEALKRVREVYPQCSKCLYHFKSPKLLEKHICYGVMMPRDVSTAMRHANGLLAEMDFSVNGAIQRASNLFGDETS